jgi:hypothetical protein
MKNKKAIKLPTGPVKSFCAKKTKENKDGYSSMLKIRSKGSSKCLSK